MLDTLIPSEDVRVYMEQTGFRFTPSELATLVYHSGKTLPVKHSYWLSLVDETGDATLRKEIRERIAYDQKCQWLFAENDGSCFYETAIGETTDDWERDEVTGHFASLELALKHAKGYGVPFDIRKYQIIGLCKNVIVPYCLFNPRLFPEGDSGESAYRGEAIAEFRYTAEGILQSYWTYEISPEETAAVEDWGKARFEWRFIRMPNPFQAGDLVRIVGTDRVGRVATSQAEWQAFLRRVEERKLAVDYSDASVTVDYSSKENPYDHQHVQPIHLEKADNGGENNTAKGGEVE